MLFMQRYRAALIGIVLLAAAGCGETDASGIYVAVADRRVTLIQLVQTPDRKLTGRVQETIVAPDGTVNETSANADGSISGPDLLLRPESAWYGGMQASGTVSGGELTLAGEGFTLVAKRSSFEKYQEAVAHLRSVASDDRQNIANSRAEEAAARDSAQADQEFANQQRAISQAVT